MSNKVLLLGVSSLAGEQLLELLEDHPLAKEVIFELYDTEEEAGRSLMVNGSALRVRSYANINLDEAKLAVLCAPEIPAETIAQIAPALTLLDLHARAQTAAGQLLLSGVAQTQLSLEKGAIKKGRFLTGLIACRGRLRAKRSNNRVTHFRCADLLHTFREDIRGAQSLIENIANRFLNTIGRITFIQRIAQHHSG